MTREDLSANPVRVTRDDIQSRINQSRQQAERSSRQARDLSDTLRTGRTPRSESAAPRPTRSPDSNRAGEIRPSDRSGEIRPLARSGRSSTGHDSGIRIIGSDRDRREPRDSGSRIVINGNNNVIVTGNVSQVRPRPYIPRKLCTSTVFIGTSPNWYDYGSYFSFHWSSSSIGRVACLPYRRHYGFSYYYPRYHRKYVFVSLGGYWPCEYRYRRYYWYGCHPHYWYGTHVIPQEPKVEYNTYNTYNYYGQTTTTAAEPSGSLYDQFATDYRYPFGDTRADLSGLFDQKTVPADEPEYESPADLCFANAVELFADGSWEDAAIQFRDAVALSPDDLIMPFAYSQALFAVGNYAHAASVLRTAMAALPEDEITIYYPRGLYEDEGVLTAQVSALEQAIAVEPFNTDFQLLLGYHYIGLGDLDKAAEPLGEAARDPANEETAAILMELAAKLEAEEAQAEADN